MNGLGWVIISSWVTTISCVFIDSIGKVFGIYLGSEGADVALTGLIFMLPVALLVTIVFGMTAVALKNRYDAEFHHSPQLRRNRSILLWYSIFVSVSLLLMPVSVLLWPSGHAFFMTMLYIAPVELVALFLLGMILSG